MAAHLIALYHQPTDTAAFDSYYAGTHAPLAKKVPGLRSYTVSKGEVSTPAGPTTNGPVRSQRSGRWREDGEVHLVQPDAVALFA